MFHYRRGGTRPFLVYFPRIEIGFSEDVSDVEQFCKEKQDKAKIMAFPVGKTRPLFIKTIRDMVKELKKMRAFACGKNKDGLLVALPGPNFKNVAVDGIITYLITIGYNNFFCVE